MSKDFSHVIYDPRYITLTRRTLDRDYTVFTVRPDEGIVIYRTREPFTTPDRQIYVSLATLNAMVTYNQTVVFCEPGGVAGVPQYFSHESMPLVYRLLPDYLGNKAFHNFVSRLDSFTSGFLGGLLFLHPEVAVEDNPPIFFIHPQDLDALIQDCKEFQSKHYQAYGFMSCDDAGEAYAYTRNRTGTGFIDLITDPSHHAHDCCDAAKSELISASHAKPPIHLDRDPATGWIHATSI